MDREAAARAIVDEAKRTRHATPRWLWVIALAIAAVCFGGLAIAWFEDRDVVAVRHLEHGEPSQSSGFATGMIFGIGLGALATSAVLLRRR